MSSRGLTLSALASMRTVLGLGCSRLFSSLLTVEYASPAILASSCWDNAASVRSFRSFAGTNTTVHHHEHYSKGTST